MHAISKLPKYRPRFYTFDVVNGNVVGTIHCIGRDGKDLHSEHFDSFIGHKRQTAKPKGIDFAQAEKNIKKYIWTGSSREVVLCEETNSDSKDETEQSDNMSGAFLNEYTSIQTDNLFTIKDVTNNIFNQAYELPSGVSDAIFDQF